MNRHNGVLLGQLVEISQGKRASVDGPAEYKRKRDFRSNSPRSLNIAIRKQESEAIAKENQKLAKRLFSHGSIYSKRKYDLDFDENIRLKKMLAKTNKKVPLAFTGRRNTALPPLTGELTDTKRKNVTNHK